MGGDRSQMPNEASVAAEPNSLEMILSALARCGYSFDKAAPGMFRHKGGGWLKSQDAIDAVNAAFAAGRAAAQLDEDKR